MICLNCGTENAEGTVACVRCGEPLRAAGAETTGPPSARPPAPQPQAEPATEGPAAAPAPSAPPPAVDQAPTEGPTEAPGPGGAGGAGRAAGAAAGPPPTPTHPVVAGRAALFVVLGVVLFGGIIWFATLRHAGATPHVAPTTPGVRPTQPRPPPTHPPTHPPTKPPPPPSRPATFTAAGCQFIGQQNTCEGQGFTQSAFATQFSIIVWIGNSKPNDVLVMSYLDPQSGQALSSPDRIVLKGRSNCQLRGQPVECANVTFTGGPFGQADLELVLTYNGAQVRFDSPVIISLR